MKINLLTCVLLGRQSDHKDVHLPNNTEAHAILEGKIIAEDSFTEADTEINNVILWLKQNKHTWYIGHCLLKNDNRTYKIKHLQIVRKSSNLKWKNPGFSNIVDMNAENIVSCGIVGD